MKVKKTEKARFTHLFYAPIACGPLSLLAPARDWSIKWCAWDREDLIR